MKQEHSKNADLLKNVLNKVKVLTFNIKIIEHILNFREKDKYTFVEEDSLIELDHGILGARL